MASTWVWILIAIVVLAVGYSTVRRRNRMNDPENIEGMDPSTEPISDSGTDSPDRASSVLRPLPDTQPQIRHAALDNAGTDSPGRASSILRPQLDTQTGQLDPASHAALDGDPSTGGQSYTQLLEDDELRSILGQWRDIQADFVDEPRKAVQDADALVLELMQRLAETFANERDQLESQWAGGDDVSTEDLRRGLRRYRSFFERLLAAGPGPGQRSRAGTD
jgi:hypothetical protein